MHGDAINAADRSTQIPRRPAGPCPRARQNSVRVERDSETAPESPRRHWGSIDPSRPGGRTRGPPQPRGGGSDPRAASGRAARGDWSWPGPGPGQIVSAANARGAKRPQYCPTLIVQACEFTFPGRALMPAPGPRRCGAARPPGLAHTRLRPAVQGAQARRQDVQMMLVVPTAQRSATSRATRPLLGLGSAQAGRTRSCRTQRLLVHSAPSPSWAAVTSTAR
jgi:hypothetical protein